MSGTGKLAVAAWSRSFPKLLAASVLGGLVHSLLGDRPAFGLVLGGASMLLGGFCTLRLGEPQPARAPSPSVLGA